MPENLIVTTPRISMQPLAFQGIMVYECFSQIRDMLLRKFGDDYVLLFAKPMENKGDGNIDWYSPVQGAPRQLVQLPESDAAPIYERLGQMANEILKFAEELIQSGEPLKVTRGNILKLALRYPDEKALYVVGGQPVYTCWGFGPGTAGVEPMILTRLTKAKPAVAPGQSSVNEQTTAAKVASQAIPSQSAARPRPGFGWLWLLFPLLAALLLFFLLFTAFGPLDPVGKVALLRLPAFWDENSDRQSEYMNLQTEIKDLYAKVRQHAALCVPAKPPVAEKPAPNPPQQELVIPENAQNTDFLEGEWLCRTGLANASTKEPVSLAFSFNKEGMGKAVTREQNGECHGAARAAIKRGILHIEIGEQTCTNGNNYSSVSIDCSNAAQGATTLCKGTHGSGSSWDATFYRVK